MSYTTTIDCLSCKASIEIEYGHTEAPTECLCSDCHMYNLLDAGRGQSGEIVYLSAIGLLSPLDIIQSHLNRFVLELKEECLCHIYEEIAGQIIARGSIKQIEPLWKRLARSAS